MANAKVEGLLQKRTDKAVRELLAEGGALDRVALTWILRELGIERDTWGHLDTRGVTPELRAIMAPEVERVRALLKERIASYRVPEKELALVTKTFEGLLKAEIERAVSHEAEQAAEAIATHLVRKAAAIYKEDS